MGEEGIALEHHGGVPLIRGQAVHPGVPDVDITGGGNLKAGDHAQDGGLAAAGRTQQGYKLTGVDGQAHTFNSFYLFTFDALINLF